MIRIIAIIIAVAFVLTSVAVIARANPPPSTRGYIGNLNTHKFHISDCSQVVKLSPSHIAHFKSKREAISAGYAPCKICKP